MLRPVVVATAAPVTPRRGNGPSPKMKQGSRQMLNALAIHSTRIAIAASPAPRNTALIRNSIRMTPLKPNRIAVNDEWASTSGVAPISARIGRANEKPSSPTGTATSRPERDRLDRGDRGALRILLAHAARDGGGRAHAEAHRDRVDHGHHRLGQADRGDRVRADARDEEDVDDREHRLEHELEHHRDRQQHDRAIDRAVGVRAVMRPGERFADRRPQARFWRRGLDVGHGCFNTEDTKDAKRSISVLVSLVSFVLDQPQALMACRRSRRFRRAGPRREGRRPARSCARDDDRRTCARRPRSSS